MVNIFCHEVGHILGLRHEFAAIREATEPSVQWGPGNPESVMDYCRNPLEMAVHELDVTLITALYNSSLDQTVYGDFPITRAEL